MYGVLGFRAKDLGFGILGFGVLGFCGANGWKTKISVTHQPSVRFETSFGLTPDQDPFGYTKLLIEILQMIPS